MTARDPITVVLLGVPTPFARMRLSRGGIHFVPVEQRNAAAALKLAAAEAMRHGGHAVLDEPLNLTLLAEFPVPRSWSKKKAARALLGEVRPAGRPDIDNLYKLAADAFSGIVYRDDALIVECWLRKVYGLQPKLVVTIAPVLSVNRANTYRPGELPLVMAA